MEKKKIKEESLFIVDGIENFFKTKDIMRDSHFRSIKYNASVEFDKQF